MLEGVTDPLLRVEDLGVRFRTEDGVVRAVDGVSFEVRPGEVLAIVGESGCGKSVTAQTIMGLTRSPNAEFEGRIHYGDRELVGASDDELRRLRGGEIAMIFQDPMTSLHPVYRLGWQIVEQIRAHQKLTAAEARERAVELLRHVGIPRPETRIDSYPHEFSGGMRQRAMIAMALSNDPRVLIADEPTTALDVTIQAQIVRLIDDLTDELGSAAILITHDLGVVAEIARIDRPASGRLPSIAGSPPSLIHRPTGCPFRPRCPHEFDPCAELPVLEGRTEDQGHLDRCWLTPEDKAARRLVEGRIGLEANVSS
jgi:peptide/nickel transport system ATP-binding protein